MRMRVGLEGRGRLTRPENTRLVVGARVPTPNVVVKGGAPFYYGTRTPQVRVVEDQIVLDWDRGSQYLKSPEATLQKKEGLPAFVRDAAGGIKNPRQFSRAKKALERYDTETLELGETVAELQARWGQNNPTPAKVSGLSNAVLAEKLRQHCWVAREDATLDVDKAMRMALDGSLARLAPRIESLLQKWLEENPGVEPGDYPRAQLVEELPQVYKYLGKCGELNFILRKNGHIKASLIRADVARPKWGTRKVNAFFTYDRREVWWVRPNTDPAEGENRMDLDTWGHFESFLKRPAWQRARLFRK